jgi:cyanobactin cluster PatC/TenC/TruC protein
MAIHGASWEESQLQVAEADKLRHTVNASFSKKTLETSLKSVLNFDGRNDYVEVSYKENLNTNQFTILCWAKVMGNPGQWRSVITSRAATPQAGYILYAGQDNKWQFWIGDGKTWITLIGSEVVLDDWTHIASTYDGKFMKLYIDGEQVGTSVEAKINLNKSYPLRIGAGATEGKPEFFFNGQILEVCLFDRVLSEGEIEKALHYQLRGNEPGFVGYWPLNEGTSNTVADKTGNGNIGTISGATWEQSEVPIQDELTILEKPVLATGLQDYGYWQKWKQSLPEKADGKPFRRGRIWA